MKIKLKKIKPSEKKEIKKIIRRKNNNKLADRARIVNLADSGYSIQEITKILNLDVRTVRQWIKRFNKEGIQGLYEHPRSGRPEKKSRYREKTLETIRKNPEEVGEAFASWTLETLHAQINNEIKGSISISTLRRILYDAGWKCRSLKSIYESNAPTQKEKIERLIEVAKEILNEAKAFHANYETFSVDESHWDLRPRNGRVWTPPEFKQIMNDIPENKGDSFTMFGALNLTSAKFIYKISHWGTAATFRQFLYQIEAQCPGKEIFLILDNASIHAAELIDKFRSLHPHIHFYFLLPRGSEVNPIERFWRYCKDKIKKGASFQTLQKLYHEVRRFFSRYSDGKYHYRLSLSLEKLVANV